MHKLSAAAACAILILTGASAAMAGTTGNGWQQRQAAAKSTGHTVTVGLGPENHRVIVTIATGNADGSNAQLTSYAYNLADSEINQLPTPTENTNPIGGIGIVVKKNPGSSAGPSCREVSAGTWTIDPSSLTTGNYNIVVIVQAHAVNTKGTGANRMASSASMTSASSTTTALPAKTMLLTFHVTVDSKGNMRSDSNMAPTATVAPSTMPTR